jgi:hypothetical protein
LGHDVFPWISSRQISRIKPTERLALLKRVEERRAIQEGATRRPIDTTTRGPL